MAQKIEDTLNRINTHKGVSGMIIVNNEGHVIKTTMGEDDTEEYGIVINRFTNNAKKAFKELHEEEEIQIIRIVSPRMEIIITPDKDYSMIII